MFKGNIQKSDIKQFWAWKHTGMKNFSIVEYLMIFSQVIKSFNLSIAYSLNDNGEDFSSDSAAGHAHTLTGSQRR